MTLDMPPPAKRVKRQVKMPLATDGAGQSHPSYEYLSRPDTNDGVFGPLVGDPSHAYLANPDPADQVFGLPHDSLTVEDEHENDMGMDSTVDRMLKKRGSKNGPPAIIFIHAGAGYHSTNNEHLHLQVCAKAAQSAMRSLKGGGTAVEAVEAAIVVLENKEITNAGFGSNLTIDGAVECDATVVDHMGRSGACGAVPCIKNPIALAKLILDQSSKTLSLRRVPPNILIGEGAKKFAAEHGMRAVNNDDLISKNAFDRYVRWYDDLKRAEEREEAMSSMQGGRLSSRDTPTDMITAGGSHRDHTAAILTGTWNEGQPDSPGLPATPDDPLIQLSPTRSRASTNSQASSARATKLIEHSPLGLLGKFPFTAQSPSRGTKRRRTSSLSCHEDGAAPPSSSTSTSTLMADSRNGASSGYDSSVTDPTEADTTQGNAYLTSERLKKPTSVKGKAIPRSVPQPNFKASSEAASDAGSDLIDLSGGVDGADQDLITDTVGAIAIDFHGNIAAGSSSGGIGMKHSGRMGPAALVGIGSAVIPCDPLDDEKKSVAAVTSGTGEHMATTVASYKCAERLYHNTCRVMGGGDGEASNDDTVLDSFITKDFMDHPGVKNQCSAGAIGVMALKQTKNSFYLYFAHNTDSFALCSLSSDDKEPHMVMSRLGPSREVTRGGRKIDLRRKIPKDDR